MNSEWINLGDGKLLNLAHCCDANWEADVLFVHFTGGGFAKYRGAAATELVRQLAKRVISTPQSPDDQTNVQGPPTPRRSASYAQTA